MGPGGSLVDPGASRGSPDLRGHAHLRLKVRLGAGGGEQGRGGNQPTKPPTYRTPMTPGLDDERHERIQ